MNLLIAVMTETSSSLTKQMKFWKLSLKLSSVALVSRRLRATATVVRVFRIGTVARFFRIDTVARLCGIDCLWYDDTYTAGGETGEETKIRREKIRTTQSQILLNATQV